MIVCFGVLKDSVMNLPTDCFLEVLCCEAFAVWIYEAVAMSWLLADIMGTVVLMTWFYAPVMKIMKDPIPDIATAV